MYKVDAIVRQERLEDVKNALVVQGFQEFTILEARGHGSHEGPTAYYRGVAYEIPFVHQVRIELNVPKTSLDIVVQAILKAACTDRPGDGKIFVTQLADVIEIDVDRDIHGSRSEPGPRAPHAQLASSIDGTSSRIW